MKVTICSCARCTAAGNEFLYDYANLIKKDLEVAYDIENLGPLPELEVVYENIMNEADKPEKSAPFAKIDDKYFKNAKPEVLMEYIFDQFHPRKRGENRWKNLT